MDNVTPINKPRGRKPKQGEKLSKGEIQKGLLDWVTGAMPFVGEKEFGNTFRAYYVDSQKEVVNLIKVKDGLATITSRRELFSEIWQKMWRLSAACAAYKAEEDVVNKVVSLFTKTKHPLFLETAPEIFCWESEKDKIAFNRVMDPPQLSHFWPSAEFMQLAPLYSDFLSRCQLPYEVRQFLGSLLDVNGDRKLALWNWGPANGGKTTFITNLLNAIFGERGFAMLSTHPDDSKFMKITLLNKLAVFGDECEPKFLKSALFKQITGGRRQHIEPKGKDAFTGIIRCKCIFASNPQPEIPRDNSFTSRILLNHVQGILDDCQLKERDIEQLLKKESPFILADIMQAHADVFGRKIKVPEDNHVDAIKAHEEPLQLLFDNLFEYVDKTREGNDFCEMTSGQYGQMLLPYLNREITLRRFNRFLKDKYGIEVGKLVKRHGKAVRMIPHLKPRV